jgi:antiviral helicase SKI2
MLPRFVAVNSSKTPNAPISTALTSTSMDRAPAPVANFVRGKSGYVPFKPGGLDDVILAAKQTTEVPIKGLRSVLPGFSRGLRLSADDPEDEALTSLDDATDHSEDKVYLSFSHVPYSCSAHIAQHIDENRALDDGTDLLPNGDSFGEIDELLPTTVRTLSCGIN